MKQDLSPLIDDLRLECVLVQAWKKTALHLRQHSWFADTLEVDYQALRLPAFLAEIRQRLDRVNSWQPTPLLVVPAPKAHDWHLDIDTGWTPKGSLSGELRPLAHISLPDQVVATAMMLCLADRVETLQGDPRLSIGVESTRKYVVSYGNRLFCDRIDGAELRHRWGSSKLYRQYYDDYRTFLERPACVVLEYGEQHSSIDSELATVHADLSKFYDRVTPELLHQKVAALQGGPREAEFFDLFRRVFDWSWADAHWAARYGSYHGIPNGFQRVALPQGLVAAGFFANVVLLDLDKRLQRAFGNTIGDMAGWVLRDACRYVDDIRLVLAVPRGTPESQIARVASAWLQRQLDDIAPTLLIEPKKTKVTVDGRERRFLIHQSKAATRIQRDASGPFDMLHGSELIGAIEGFFYTQRRYSQAAPTADPKSPGLLVGMSDIRDDTAARFAAGKFRRTFRSLRPLLDDEPISADDEQRPDYPRSRALVLSKEQLDERGRLFAAMLIEEWVANPANVRLLRIALDLLPDREFLDRVLGLLRAGWQVGGWRRERREVALYCLSELFRAGATETGLVPDDECLPGGLSADGYHERLMTEARAVVLAYLDAPTAKQRFPWYLLQQAILYLAVRDDRDTLAKIAKAKGSRFARHRALSRFLGGERSVSVEQRSIFAALAVSAFGHTSVLDSLATSGATPQFIIHLTHTAPSVAIELWERLESTATPAQRESARQVGLIVDRASSRRVSLPVAAAAEVNPFLDEGNLLNLADAMLARRPEVAAESVTPWQIVCEMEPSATHENRLPKIATSKFAIGEGLPRARALFAAPDWCDAADQRRTELGFILRFALRGSVDFHRAKRRSHVSGKPRYRVPVSHWEQSRYGAYQGRRAFGPDWLPISSWVETLLFELLRWPGCGIREEPWTLDRVKQEVADRRKRLDEVRATTSDLLVLEQLAPWPGPPPNGTWERPLRIGIVQSVVPCMSDYETRSSDPELTGDPVFRRRQRRHLAAVMEGVSQMLRIRETHCPQARIDGRVIDWLILPELAVQPTDVGRIILPFVRTHRCMVLMGLVYHREPSLPGSPLVNSALWIIPEWSRSTGLQIRRLEQGKRHLTAGERQLTPTPVPFRPAQWIVNYQWHSNQASPLRLTASICYDATDIRLAADLNRRTDIYAILALNQDVGTFDRMVEGMHFHMYQGMLVVNNGQFGGSNFYAPFEKPYHRQVFHLHGQPQAQVAFVEVCPEKFIQRPNLVPGAPEGEWKTPPAGWSRA